MFKKAVKKQLKAKIMMDGPSGSGKTYSALLIAQGLAGENGKIGFLDTENKSASIYASIFNFDVVDLKAPFSPEAYINIIKEAVNIYDVLVIDSITHEWAGEGGCLDIKAAIGHRYQDWDKVTPRHNRFINAIINAPIHIISTCRTKTGYEMGKNSEGNTTVNKLGLQPITRDGFEYENTVVFTLNENNMAVSTKDRTSLFNGKHFKVTKETGEELLEFLNDGEEVKIDFKGPIDTLFKNPSEDGLEKCLTWLEKNKAPDDIREYYHVKAVDFFDKQQKLQEETK